MASGVLVAGEGPAQLAAAVAGFVVAGVGAGPLYVGECLLFAASARASARARGDGDEAGFVFSSAAGFHAPAFDNALFGDACGVEGAIVVGALLAGGSLGGSHAGCVVAVLTGTASIVAVPPSLLGGARGGGEGA